MIFVEVFRVARIIIDGYNLIGVHHRDLEARRRELLRSLIAYRKARGHEITLVFDGQGGLSSRETVRTEGGVRVIFSRIARKADDVIKELLARGRHFIVVSSDREIADFAWGHGSVPVRSDDFLRKLSAAVSAGKAGGRDLARLGGEEWDETDGLAGKMFLDEEDEDDRPRRKGSPYKASKRRKAVARALNKL